MQNKLKDTFREHYGFFIIFSVGIILRLIFLLTQGMSHDELSAWNRTNVHDFSELISVGVGGDMHPAFFQILLTYWVHWFGDSAFVFRLPAVLFGLGGIALLYKTGIRFFSKQAALLAVAGLSIFVFPILHTSLSRPYAPGFFFISLLVYGILDYRNQTEKPIYFKGLLLTFIGLTGSMYSHYYAFVCAAIISFITLFYLNKRQLTGFIITGILALIAFIPHIDLTLHHFSKGGLGWLGKPGSFWLFEFFKLYFNDSQLLFILIAGGISFAYYAHKRAIDKLTAFPLLIFFGIYFAGHAVSILYTPILREPGQLFTIGFLFLGLGHMLSSIDLQKYTRLLVLVCVLLSIHSLTLGKLTRPVHFEPFREVAGLISEYDQQIDPDKMIRLVNVTNTNYLNYYGRAENMSQDFEMTLIEETEEIYHLSDLIQNAEQEEYVMLARVNRRHHPVLYEIIRRKYPKVVRHEDFFNADFSVWEKSPGFSRKFEHNYNSSNSPELFTQWKKDTLSEEFFGDIRIPVKQLSQPGTYILVEAKGWHDSATTSLPFVAVLENQGEMRIKDEQPLYYQAWDQIRLETKPSGSFFIAFEIPETAKENDEIHLYFWNPEKKPLFVHPPDIYVVNPNY